MQTWEIESIAVLLTCHNRKDKTIECLRSLYNSKAACQTEFEMNVYLTDDGSEDGTDRFVKEQFPDVKLLYGNGNLFWTGGMIHSWTRALEKQHDAFLLLNDDAILFKNCLEELFKTHEYCVNNYGLSGISVGSVVDPKTKVLTYGGRNILNKWTYKTQMVVPDGTINECQLGNANIMLVHADVVKNIGIFSDRFVQKGADFEYTLRARENEIPVLVCSTYCGSCEYDHVPHDLKGMTLRERIQYLKSPKGIGFSGYIYYMRRFFPWRAPFVFISLWLRVLIPGSIAIIDKMLNRVQSE